MQGIGGNGKGYWVGDSVETLIVRKVFSCKKQSYAEGGFVGSKI